MYICGVGGRGLRELIDGYVVSNEGSGLVVVNAVFDRTLKFVFLCSNVRRFVRRGYSGRGER